MRTVTFLPVAQDDLDTIYYHYAFEREAPQIADRILANIREQAEHFLSSQPMLGRKISSTKDMRDFLVGRTHWVGYTFDDKSVYVHRVIAAKALHLGTTFEKQSHCSYSSSSLPRFHLCHPLIDSAF